MLALSLNNGSNIFLCPHAPISLMPRINTNLHCAWKLERKHPPSNLVGAPCKRSSKFNSRVPSPRQILFPISILPRYHIGTCTPRDRITTEDSPSLNVSHWIHEPHNSDTVNQCASTWVHESCVRD